MAHNKFITEFEVLLGITNREELDILERGPGLVSVIDLLEEASEYFPGDEVLEAVVLDIYESVDEHPTALSAYFAISDYLRCSHDIWTQCMTQTLF
jgi:hypothetical protein